MKYAYAAGVIDGDGTITGVLSQLRIQICVSMKDPLIPQWLKRHFGGEVYKEKNYREMFSWRLTGLACKEFLERIFHHLVQKSPQAAVALEFISTMPGRGRGHGKSEELVNRQLLLMMTLQLLNKGGSTCVIR